MRSSHWVSFFIFILKEYFCHSGLFQAFFLHSLKLGPAFDPELPHDQIIVMMVMQAVLLRSH